MSEDASMSEDGSPPPSKKYSLPNDAILDPERKLFRLRKSAGGTIAKGAFGFFMSASSTSSTSTSTPEIETIHQSSGTTEVPLESEPAEVCWCLFIEEVIYLHERGLLAAYSPTNVRLESFDLYELLPAHGMPLAVYLVYAHLRVQTFKVVRYSRARRNVILQQIISAAAQDVALAKDHRRLLREAAAAARPPPESNLSQSLAWDVYPPDVIHRKSEPGLPAFSVVVTHYTTADVPFARLQSLVHENAAVPLKIATVSDCGTVVLFGVTDLGAPAMISRSPPGEEEDDDDDVTSNDKEP
jgi:hypothetical protein